jgi:hypothetical protein
VFPESVCCAGSGWLSPWYTIRPSGSASQLHLFVAADSVDAAASRVHTVVMKALFPEQPCSTVVGTCLSPPRFTAAFRRRVSPPRCRRRISAHTLTSL